MKACLLVVFEMTVLVAMMVAIAVQPAMLDRVMGMPSPNERLLTAASAGDQQLVDEALADGASLNARSAGDESNVLHFAAQLGHVSLVQEFIAQGVDVNERNSNGWTPLMFAASNDQAPVVRVLLAHGADPRIRASYAPFDVFHMAEQRMTTRTLVVLREWEQGAHQNAGAPAAED